jgi:hypothetical protein
MSIIPFESGSPTICVRGAWRWGGREFCLGAEKKLEARKMLENGDESYIRCTLYWAHFNLMCLVGMQQAF